MRGDRYPVTQRIEGAGHQIAGRDLINEGDGFKPDPRRPGLRDCDYCGWEALAVKAPACPKCGHSYERDWMQAARRNEWDRQRSVKLLFIATIILLTLSANVSAATGLHFLEALPLAAILAGVLWYAWILTVSRLTAWWRSQKVR